jgi:cytochrome b involved in lipid metabolism
MCGGDASDTRVVTLAEVSKHRYPSDCWVIIHRSVYDVTRYIPKHPGGAMIYVKAGGDCSQLFDSYHRRPHVRYPFTWVLPSPGLQEEIVTRF